MIRFALAVFALATPAAAQDIAATQFNGYSVTIIAQVLNSQKPSERAIKDASEKASEICSSVGKSAVFESSLSAQKFRAQLFFTCR